MAALEAYAMILKHLFATRNRRADAQPDGSPLCKLPSQPGKNFAPLDPSRREQCQQSGKGAPCNRRRLSSLNTTCPGVRQLTGLRTRLRAGSGQVATTWSTARWYTNRGALRGGCGSDRTGCLLNRLS
jgi:hypothetical protein